MIKTIWFFIKIAIIAGAGVWLATRQGDVSLSIMQYDITIQSGLFFLLLFIACITFLLIYRVVRAVLSTPKVIAKYQEQDKQKKGYNALTQGLIAVAAGDAKKATEYADKTQDFMPDQNALTLLLAAQAARLRGEEGKAENYFKELSDDKEARFLGLRGLLVNALSVKDYSAALTYARQADKAYAGQGWLLAMIYSLEIKNHAWQSAVATGKRAVKASGLDEDKILSDRIALHLMHGDYERDQENENAALKEFEAAYKINPYFVPTIVRLLRFYLAKNRRKKAISLIQKTWKESPHPDLAMIWEELAPLKGKKNNANAKRLKWFEDLVAINPDSYDGQVMAANAAMDLGYWGEAKSYLTHAEKIYPSASLYRFMAVAEQNSGDNDAIIHALMEKASEALPDKSWHCAQTGLIYQEWSPLAMPHEGFNTIIWGVPGETKLTSQNNIDTLSIPHLLVDPAA